MTPPRQQDIDLARYIFEWLAARNGGELANALDSMTVRDQRIAHEELAQILMHGGKPPNWIA